MKIYKKFIIVIITTYGTPRMRLPMILNGFSVTLSENISEAFSRRKSETIPGSAPEITDEIVLRFLT